MKGKFYHFRLRLDSSLKARLLLVVILFFTQSLILMAQQGPIMVSGTITDINGNPVTGVTIVEQGTVNGSITNLQGEYTIKVKNQKAILSFSFIGYKTINMPVGYNTTLNPVMEEDAIGLEEVVAIGYGSQKRASITGSVATISSDKLTVAPLASTTNALAGRLPGLISKQESGLPGADRATLSIRGFGAPLVIVDGIESDFNNIDANEIESVTVLKDASAAIYGARAGDGVILVTTKRGTVDKPTITFQSTMTFQGYTQLSKPAGSGQQAELMREEHFNQGKPEETQRFSQEEVDLFYAGTNPDYPNTDWAGLLISDWTPQQQHNLSVRGGSEKIKYYGFLGYLDQQSMWKNNGGEYKRYNFRSNIDAKILDNLTMKLDLSSIIENRDFPSRSDEKDYSVWQEYWNTEPFLSPTLPDPSKLAYGGAGGSIGLHYMTNSELSGYRKTNTQNLNGSLSLKYDFLHVKGLSAKAFGNYSQGYSFFKHFNYLSDSWSYNHANDTYTQRTFSTVPELRHDDSKSRTLTGQLSINFDRNFGEDHHVTGLLLYEVIDFSNDWIRATRQGFKTTAIDYLFAGGLANQTANGSASETGRQSYIGRLNYSYKSKYLVEGTWRIDESAKFGADQRRGIFPSISMGWRISEENFIKDNISIIRNLKLRASMSQTGKDAVGNFQYLAGYGFGSKYLMGNEATVSLMATGLANPFLTWEEMTLYNAGLDFALAKRIIYGEFDVFYRERDGIPGTRNRSLPSTFGAALPLENLNNINTRGFELTLGHEGQAQDFKWNVNANISWSRSKWGSFDEPVYEDPDQERINMKTGEWTDRAFGYISEGLFVDQAEIDGLDFVYNETTGNEGVKPGSIRYKDENEDGLLDWKDNVEIGKGTTPHWIGGLNFNLQYKNFDMSALFQGAFGFNQKIALRWGNMLSELYYNERWTPENNSKDALIPAHGTTQASGSSDFFYKKADYLRLKSLSIGYNLPSNLLNRVNIKELRFFVSGTNLFTISEMNKYDIDPEAPSGEGYRFYPQARTISFGLNLSL